MALKSSGYEPVGKSSHVGKFDSLDDDDLDIFVEREDGTETGSRSSFTFQVSCKNICILLFTTFAIFLGGIYIGNLYYEMVSKTELLPTSQPVAKITTIEPTTPPKPVLTKKPLPPPTNEPTPQPQEVTTSQPTTRPHEITTNQPTTRPHEVSTNQPTTRPHEEATSQPTTGKPTTIKSGVKAPTPGNEFLKARLNAQYGNIFLSEKEAEDFSAKQDIWRVKHRKKMKKANEDLLKWYLEDEQGRRNSKSDFFHLKQCDEINDWTTKEIEKAIGKIDNSMDIFTKPLDGGKSYYDLGFDPNASKAKFTEYRRRLVEWYEVEDEKMFSQIFDAFDPKIGTKARTPGMKAIADRFIRKIVNKQPLVVAVMGTSVMAGQDNCFEYAYPRTFERTMGRILAAVNTNIQVRAEGQNGDGVAVKPQLACYKDIVNDADFVQTGYWMIPRPGQAEGEVWLRRLLTHDPYRPLLHSIDGGAKGFGLWDDYFHLGVMELKDGNWRARYEYAEDKTSIFPWWPNKLGHWGRQGDGRCHSKTREGVDHTIMQNWHPGPGGFQQMMDLLLFHYLEALIIAMDEITSEVSTLGNVQSVLSHLQKKWPLKGPHVTLPPPMYADCDDNEFCVELKKTINGFPTTCIHGFHEVQDKSTSWEYWANKTREKIPEKLKSQFPGSVDLKLEMLKRTSQMKNPAEPSHRTNRTIYESNPLCNAHRDYGMGYKLKGDSGVWFTTLLPKMTKGIVKICMNSHSHSNIEDMSVVEFMINGQPVIKPPVRPYKWTNVCDVVTEKAPVNSDDVYLSIRVHTSVTYPLWGVIVE